MISNIALLFLPFLIFANSLKKLKRRRGGWGIYAVGSRWLRCYWPVQIRGADPHLMLDDLSTERRLTSFCALFTAAVWPEGTRVPAERVNGPVCPRRRTSQLPMDSLKLLYYLSAHINTSHWRGGLLMAVVFYSKLILDFFHTLAFTETFFPVPPSPQCCQRD